MKVHLMTTTVRKKSLRPWVVDKFHKVKCSGVLIKAEDGVTTTTVSKITCVHCLGFLLKDLDRKVESVRQQIAKASREAT